MCKALAQNSGSGYDVIATGTVAADAIDYYIPLLDQRPVGTPLVFCFRTQVFVTRSEVALVEGIQSGTPRVVGIYDSQGRWLR